MTKIMELIKLYFMSRQAVNHMRQQIAGQEEMMHQQEILQQQMGQQAIQRQEAEAITQQLFEQQQEIIQQTMREGIKSVLPFDFGGYVQGPGFNPSDTMMQMQNDMVNPMF
mgnify:CR=1 FL=1